MLVYLALHRSPHIAIVPSPRSFGLYYPSRDPVAREAWRRMGTEQRMDWTLFARNATLGKVNQKVSIGSNGSELWMWEKSKFWPENAAKIVSLSPENKVQCPTQRAHAFSSRHSHRVDDLQKTHWWIKEFLSTHNYNYNYYHQPW